MKRGGPLKRRTPLKRSAGVFRRRLPLRSVGKRAKAEAAAGETFRAEVRARAGGLCEGRTPACPDGPHVGDHAHHVGRRRGSDKHDAATNGKWLCWAGHDWCHLNPHAAEALGLLRRSGVR